MTTITLTDDELELVRRETMQAVARDLRQLAGELDELALVAPWPCFPLNHDIHTAKDTALESLGTLDALGWPPKDRT